MKILVTGDSGFIASFLIPRLINKGHEVVGIDLVPYNRQTFTHRQIIGNIADRNAVLKAAQDMDCIIHLAAVHTDEGPTKEDYFYTNATGTEVLLDVAGKLNINQFFFFSTVGIYGNISPADETTLPMPNNNYGFSKLKAEEAIVKWCQDNTIRKAIIIRPTAVYGPGNKANIFRLIKQVSIGNFRIVGNGKNKKAIIFVKNVVSSVMYLLEHFNNQIDVYNLIDYPILTINSLTTTIAKINKKDLSKFKIPLIPATMLITIFNGVLWLIRQKPMITKMRLKKFCDNTEYCADKIRQIGYQQDISTESGLRETIKWNKTHDWQKEITEK